MYVLQVVCVTILCVVARGGYTLNVTDTPADDTSTPAPAAWRVQDYPNPLTDWHQCGRNKSSYLCDPDGILSRQDVAILDNLLLNVTMETGCPCENATLCNQWTTDNVILVNDTVAGCRGNFTTTSCGSCQAGSSCGVLMSCRSCGCAGSCETVMSGCVNQSMTCTEVSGRGGGYVMIVALMQRMTLITSQYKETVDLAANRYADYFRDNWKFGRCQEAIVVVISMDEHQIYTSTEEAAGRRLSDIDLVHLYRDYVTDDFWTGNITHRLPALLQQYIVLINTPDPPPRLFDVWLNSWGTPFLLALIVASIASCIIYKHRLKMYKKFPACCQKRWINIKSKGRKANVIMESRHGTELSYAETIESLQLRYEEEKLKARRIRQQNTWY